MNKKLWIAVLAVAVAAAAFVGGWQLRRLQEPSEAVPASEPEPASEPFAASSAAEPAATSGPARRAPASQPSSAPAASPFATAPAGDPAPAESGVRRVETREVRLAAGTKIAFALNDSLSTKTSRVGDPFSGAVSRSVRVGETLVIPEGSVVHGSVSHVERAGRVKGRSELGLRFEKLELPDGQALDLTASLTELDEREKETVTEEGQVKGEGTKKRDAVTIGGGAGIGAAIGALAGGGKGAATGTAVGAGAGTAVVLLTRGKDVELARGTELAIQLDRPLRVPVQ